jgi:hypothetical protein
VVESSGLLNRRRPLKSTGGSNPPLSARIRLNFTLILAIACAVCFAAILLLSFCLPALADLAAGQQALKNADYAAAFREFLPLAEKGNAFAQDFSRSYVQLRRKRPAGL